MNPLDSQAAVRDQYIRDQYILDGEVSLARDVSRYSASILQVRRGVCGSCRGAGTCRASGWVIRRSEATHRVAENS